MRRYEDFTTLRHPPWWDQTGCHNVHGCACPLPLDGKKRTNERTDGRTDGRRVGWRLTTLQHPPWWDQVGCHNVYGCEWPLPLDGKKGPTNGRTNSGRTAIQGVGWIHTTLRHPPWWDQAGCHNVHGCALPSDGKKWTKKRTVNERRWILTTLQHPPWWDQAGCQRRGQQSKVL